MENLDEQFARIQEKIKREHGEDVQRALLEGALEEYIKKTGRTLPPSAYEEIRKHIGLDVNTTTENEKCVKLLYYSAQARVLLVADQIEKYAGDVTALRADAQKMVVPNDREWGFKLGDNVRVKGSLEDFASLQKETLGWTGRLKVVYGNTGYVRGVMSDYDNAVHVCFPEIGAKCALYAGALEKIETKTFSKRHLEWKVGDFVQTHNDLKLVNIMQGKLLPTGKRGQVVGFSYRSVLVTFDNETVHEVNPAVLLRSGSVDDVSSKSELQAGGFEVGQKAKVLNNMKKLIDNQKNQMTSGGWCESMISLRGKEVTILKVNELGGLNVQCEGGRPWRISSNSILRLNQEEASASELEFTIDDVVRVKIPSDIRSILDNAGISLTFIEYLRLTGEVAAVGGDYQPYVRFWNWTRQIEFNSALLRKLGSPEKEKKYREIKQKTESLEAGHIVYLDVGPPNFVAEVLKSAGRDDSIVMALTNSAVLKGYLDNNIAVIEYEDGTRYKVKKKLLTVPERFYVEGSEKEIDLEVSRRIVKAIETATRHITSQQKVIKASNVSSGNPPSIDITTYSPVSHKDLTEWLQKNRNWRIEMLCEGQILIRGDDFGKVKVRISFGEEMGKNDTSASEIVGDYNFKGSSELEARPVVVNRPTDEELSQIRPRNMRFHDTALRQDVYFPSVVHGPHRTPRTSENVNVAPAKITNIFHINDSNIGNIKTSGDKQIFE